MHVTILATTCTIANTKGQSLQVKAKLDLPTFLVLYTIPIVVYNAYWLYITAIPLGLLPLVTQFICFSKKNMDQSHNEYHFPPLLSVYFFYTTGAYCASEYNCCQFQWRQQCIPLINELWFSSQNRYTVHVFKWDLLT